MPPAPLTFTVSQMITILLALIGGAGVIGAIIFAGVWDRFFKTKVRQEIKTFNGEPDNLEAFEKAVNKVIDNQINRRDGIIHKEISKQVEDGNAKVLGEIKALREELGDMTEIGSRLGHIEGSMKVLLNALRVPPIPPTNPPTG